MGGAEVTEVAGALSQLKELGGLGMVLGFIAYLLVRHCIPVIKEHLIPAWERMAQQREESIRQVNANLVEVMNRTREDNKGALAELAKAINRNNGLVLAFGELCSIDRARLAKRAEEISGERVE